MDTFHGKKEGFDRSIERSNYFSMNIFKDQYPFSVVFDFI